MATIKPINYTIQERMNARLLSAGSKTIDGVVESNSPRVDRVNVYCYAIDEYGYDILEVDERYVDEVKGKFGV
ncbi:MAG: hypothetical protein ACRDDX_10600 [Cellulosilyticaceae bacterium]